MPKTNVGKLDKMMREHYVKKKGEEFCKICLFAAKYGVSPERAQHSDSDTSQDQEGDIAEEGYGEKAESSSAHEAPVCIDS